MADSRPPIDEVHAAFMAARADAQCVPTGVLVRRVKQLETVEDDFWSSDFIRRCAMRHELADRGVPS